MGLFGRKIGLMKVPLYVVSAADVLVCVVCVEVHKGIEGALSHWMSKGVLSSM